MKKNHNNGTVSSKLTFLSIETGRGPSIWDTYSHVKGNIENNDTGDIACDSYHNYMRDVELLKELGVKASFCISLFNLFEKSFTWNNLTDLF